jgi:hypothetical protein
MEQVFIKDLSVLCFVHLSLDAATPMIQCRDGASFPPGVMLGIQAKEFSLGFIRPENLVSRGLRVI